MVFDLHEVRVGTFEIRVRVCEGRGGGSEHQIGKEMTKIGHTDIHTHTHRHNRDHGHNTPSGKRPRSAV